MPIRFIFFLIVFFSRLAVPCIADSPKADRIAVGVVLPLSGEVAAIGMSIRNGIEIAYQSLPENVKEKIELHYEDDGFIPKNSVTALNRLIADKKIDVLINGGSSTANSMAPIAESNKIPFLAIATDVTVSRGRNYVMNFWVSAHVETDLVLSEMKKRGYRKIARIMTTHDMNTEVKRAFDRANSGDIDLTIDEEYSTDTRDFRTFLAKIRQRKDTDAVLTLLVPGQLGLFAKQAREMGITLPLVGYEFFEDPGEVAIANGALLGQWYTMADEPTESFSKTYHAKHPGAAIFGAANGHDAIMLIRNAIEHGTPMKEFHTFLRGLRNFSGALGTYSFASEETSYNTFTLPACLKTVTKDGFEKFR